MMYAFRNRFLGSAQEIVALIFVDPFMDPHLPPTELAVRSEAPWATP